jgi:hypothetical protein
MGEPSLTERKLFEARAEVARLQSVIDSRPAINAGLPETYIAWSKLIAADEFNRALEKLAERDDGR